MSLLYGFVRILCKIVTEVGFGIKVSGKENFGKTQRVLLCCNHQSFWDMPILIACVPFQIHFLAKKELFKNKLFTFVLESIGVIPVNRGSNDVGAVKKSEAVLESGVLGIFPEGTRRPLEKPDKFKAGAALMALHTNSQILPVAINYNGKIKIFGKVNVNFGKMLSTEEYSRDKAGGALPKTAIKNLNNDITQEIISLWEMKE